MKKCSVCRLYKEPTEYCKDKLHKDGLACKCKLCKKTHRTRDKAVIPEGHKKCGKCQEVKEVTLFNKNKATKTGLSNECIPCRKVRNALREGKYKPSQEVIDRRRERDRVRKQVQVLKRRNNAVQEDRARQERRRKEKMIAMIESKSSTTLFKMPEKFVGKPRITKGGKSHYYWKAPMLSGKEAKDIRKGILDTIDKLLGK